MLARPPRSSFPYLKPLLVAFLFLNSHSISYAASPEGAERPVTFPLEFESSSRAEAEPWKNAAVRTMGPMIGRLYSSTSPTAIEKRHSVSQVDEVDVQQWNSSISMRSAFQKIRDDRFMTDPARPDFPRRISWLYPDDGCFARAELMSLKLQQAGYPMPTKVFAFGDLSTLTPYSPSGSVHWWYHVAIAYRIGHEVIVFDPSVVAQRPAPLQEWLGLIGGTAKLVEISFCEGTALFPKSPCRGRVPLSMEAAVKLEDKFLSLEWNRMTLLNLAPEAVLAERAPWI